ncbi:unnamed protein product [Strongylus vulgaris]|uniref:Uncharacterized protein n=1 Tax=Strongylus vulgaris TaxID=40348 RepID=A0A3P7IJD2_STRVU|nr:unnamed protein product [Strongylus vulgaris]
MHSTSLRTSQFRYEINVSSSRWAGHIMRTDDRNTKNSGMESSQNVLEVATDQMGRRVRCMDGPAKFSTGNE